MDSFIFNHLKNNTMKKINFHYMHSLLLILIIIAASSVLNSCTKDNNSFSGDKAFNISLNTMNEVPSVIGRTETGTAVIILHTDYTLEWSIQIDDLSGQDALTTAQINFGDPATHGDELINLVDNTELKFVGGIANGSKKISEYQATKIKTGDVYLNVNSNQEPEGLLRGQLDKTIIWALDVSLSPENETPAITDRIDRGIAILRFTDDDMLYSNIQLMNVLSADSITTANIEEGALGEHGGSMVLLVSSKSDYGASKKIKLMPTVLMHLKEDAHHVNIHSMLKPTGLMCGQLQ